MTHYHARLSAHDDRDGWRALARILLSHAIAPQYIEWTIGAAGASLFGGIDASALSLNAEKRPRASREFVTLLERALLHRDEQRFALAYAIAWRLQAEPHLMAMVTDAQVRTMHGLAKDVGRDIHKMKAFVRFRELPTDGGASVFIAWFEPRHHILKAVAPFFVRRFASQNFIILTPSGSLQWDGHAVNYGEGASKADLPAQDAGEELWKRYYASIFNPARLKPKAMQGQMPKRYWKNLPEASLIPALLAGARARETAMVERMVNPKTARRRAGPAPSAAPATALPELAAQIQTCRRCPLHECATRAVTAVGPSDAVIMIVGEQPGDEEDIRGIPFVGPAGQMLDAVFTEASIARDSMILTNAVKHFKFLPRGKRRIHQKPDAAEIIACKGWLEQEIALVRPKVIIALGATALSALGIRNIPVSQARNVPLVHPSGASIIASWHPAAILRQPDRLRAQTLRDEMLADIRRAWAGV